MTLPLSGAISIDDLKAEFGVSNNNLGAFYRGGAVVPDTPANAGVPASGPISLQDFYGASALQILLETTITIGTATSGYYSGTTSYTGTSSFQAWTLYSQDLLRGFDGISDGYFDDYVYTGYATFASNYRQAQNPNNFGSIANAAFTDHGGTPRTVGYAVNAFSPNKTFYFGLTDDHPGNTDNVFTKLVLNGQELLRSNAQYIQTGWGNQYFWRWAGVTDLPASGSVPFRIE